MIVGKVYDITMYKNISGIHKVDAKATTTDALQPIVTKSPKNPGNV
jgi:hypothetical protein